MILKRAQAESFPLLNIRKTYVVPLEQRNSVDAKRDASMVTQKTSLAGLLSKSPSPGFVTTLWSARTALRVRSQPPPMGRADLLVAQCS